MKKSLATYIALGLATLAVSKILHQEYLYRSTAESLVLSSHGKAARLACLAIAARKKSSGNGWSRPSSTRFIIGDRSLNVGFWRYGSPKWDARFRDPYIRMEAGSSLRRYTCTYDIKRRTATIAAL